MFGTFSSLGARMQTRGLVCLLFLGQTTWFGIPNFCNGKGELVGHGVEDHDVHDNNDVEVCYRLVEAPMECIKSPLSKGVCQLGGVGWLG